MTGAKEALQRLREGNARFVAGELQSDSLHHQARREEVADEQAPFAVIVGCSDSRVPVEIVFDQSLGDLFVIRVAGNVISHTQLGSIEFAAAELGARLVVVLGHTRCGAMQAALEAVQRGRVPPSEHLRLIVDEIRPAVETAIERGGDCEPGALVNLAGRENVRRSAEKIRAESSVVRELADRDGLLVVGAQYSLGTGEVEFF